MVAAYDSGDSAVNSTVKRRSLSEILASDGENNNKRVKLESDVSNNNKEIVEVVLPLGFLDPLPNLEVNKNKTTKTSNGTTSSALVVPRGGSCKQFWKAGDYEGHSAVDLALNSSNSSVGMDHARVHPKFLHSNATSHKWALGAFAELLDNALDEVCNGATYVYVDMLMNEKQRQTMSTNDDDKDGNRMLLVQDNGGGMRPEIMRNCMSLGYSAKSKMANTIGQYGNGFKTSTMRLGADVIVFSCCQTKDGACPTRSIGMLSYTFLTRTGKQDTVVPMIDYEKKGNVWTKMLPGSLDNWNLNLDTITEWSPYSSEQGLLKQFDLLDEQGTRIIIYNLWEDDMRQLELDFDTDSNDIQIRGVNRDEKKIDMARKYPNSKHFLTYQHSLRNYASILYLRLPPGFRIILRGKDVEHHNLANDMVHKKETKYRPTLVDNGTEKDPGVIPEVIQAFVTLGFVKGAEDHIDIQGFNVYHKNRLIKPFWRVWNAAGSDGRGVIGVLEADFVEPAHDKQGFERTTALERLEARLRDLQKSYWRSNCQMIGYAARRVVKRTPLAVVPYTPNGTLPDRAVRKNVQPRLSNSDPSESDVRSTHLETPPSRQYTPNGTLPDRAVRKNVQQRMSNSGPSEGDFRSTHLETPPSRQKSSSSLKLSRPGSNNNLLTPQSGNNNGKLGTTLPQERNGKLVTTPSQERNEILCRSSDMNEDLIVNLRKENLELKKRLHDANELSRVDDLQQQLQLERDRITSLESQLEEANNRCAEMDKEHEALIDIFAEERERRDAEEVILRKRLQDDSRLIDELFEKVGDRNR